MRGDGLGLILSISMGNFISPSDLLRHFKKVASLNDLTEIRFHVLRHTYAAFLLAARVHPKVVQ